MALGWILAGFWEGLGGHVGPQKLTKVNKKSSKKVIDDKMDVGMGFGWLLGRCLVDFGTQLGGKLVSSWHQNLIKWDTKTMSKKHQKKKRSKVGEAV